MIGLAGGGGIAVADNPIIREMRGQGDGGRRWVAWPGSGSHAAASGGIARRRAAMKGYNEAEECSSEFGWDRSRSDMIRRIAWFPIS